MRHLFTILRASCEETLYDFYLVLSLVEKIATAHVRQGKQAGADERALIICDSACGPVVKCCRIKFSA